MTAGKPSRAKSIFKILRVKKVVRTAKKRERRPFADAPLVAREKIGLRIAVESQVDGKNSRDVAPGAI